MIEHFSLILTEPDPDGPCIRFDPFLDAGPRLQHQHSDRLKQLTNTPNSPMGVWVGFTQLHPDKPLRSRPVGAVALYNRYATDEGLEIGVEHRRLNYTAVRPNRRDCLNAGVAFAIAMGARAIYTTDSRTRSIRSSVTETLGVSDARFAELSQARRVLTPQYELPPEGTIMHNLARIGITAATIAPDHPWQNTLQRAEALRRTV
jgi:hypothetical protein